MTESWHAYGLGMPALNRRDFLHLSGLTGAVAALASCKPLGPSRSFAKSSSTIEEHAVPDTDADQTWNALRRLTFGPLAAEIAHARSVGLDAYVEEQLSPEEISDSDVEARLMGLQTLEMPPADLLGIEPRSRPITELIYATALRAVFSKRQLFELLVDFWNNHFNIYIQKGPVAYLKVVDDREVIRKHALGRFGDLLLASARSPAMLVYLDNAQSTRDRPNENYARELLELHTMGVDGGYTHSDVEAVARAFTGWTVMGMRSPEPGTFFFNPRAHDDGTKGFLGKVLPAGQSQRDGEQVLEMLAAHPATATHISTKLVRRFVSDQPPRTLVDRAAETYLQTGGEIREVLRTILLSPEFLGSAGQKVKRPFEYMVSAIRLTESPLTQDRQLGGFLQQMGQPLFQWPPPNGFPDVADAWISTSGMMARWNFALALSFGAFQETQVDWGNLAAGETSASGILNQLSMRFLPRQLPEEAQEIILQFTSRLPPGSDLLLPATGALILCSPYFQIR